MAVSIEEARTELSKALSADTDEAATTIERLLGADELFGARVIEPDTEEDLAPALADQIDRLLDRPSASVVGPPLSYRFEADDADDLPEGRDLVWAQTGTFVDDGGSAIAEYLHVAGISRLSTEDANVSLTPVAVSEYVLIVLAETPGGDVDQVVRIVLSEPDEREELPEDLVEAWHLREKLLRLAEDAWTLHFEDED